MLNGPIGDLSDGERKKEKKSKTVVSATLEHVWQYSCGYFLNNFLY